LLEKTTSNLLLGGLPRGMQSELRGVMSFVGLPTGLSLERSGQFATHAYFPTDGVVSLIARGRNGSNVEAALVGREGLVGLSLVLGAGPCLSDAVMQSAGFGWRIAAADFRAAMEREVFRLRMLHFVSTLISQSFTTSLAASRAKLVVRLARWLLLYRDRVGGDEFEVTHDTMALMLGVRRAGVTVTLHELEGAGLIRSNRGRVAIRDRDGLMSLAGEFYGQAEGRYERLLAPFRNKT
jgi:CRP-like cAMP-binding protein